MTAGNMPSGIGTGGNAPCGLGTGGKAVMWRTSAANAAKRLGSAVVLFLLCAGAVFVLFPIYMALINSFKSDGEILSRIMALQESLDFSHYAEAYRKTHFLRSLWNTMVVAAVGLFGIIFCSSMAGYKLSRTPGKLSAALFGLFVFSMLVPFHSIMIPLTRIARQLSVQGSTIGLGLIYTGLGVSMAIFLYHGFVKSVPRELDEAAVIDGCGEFRLFFTVVFPLLLPITSTIAILNLLWIWNDFLLPLLMLTDSRDYTLLLSTNMLFGEYGNNDWSAILASLILAVMPVIVFYLLLQKQIVKGIAAGAIKG